MCHVISLCISNTLKCKGHWMCLWFLLPWFCYCRKILNSFLHLLWKQNLSMCASACLCIHSTIRALQTQGNPITVPQNMCISLGAFLQTHILLAGAQSVPAWSVLICNFIKSVPFSMCKEENGKPIVFLRVIHTVVADMATDWSGLSY